MKNLSKVLFAAVFFGALGWLGMYLYWHFKVVGAIKTLETQAAPAQPGSPLPYSLPEEPLAEVRSAGCRALPYLVSSLEPSKSPAYLLGAYDLIHKCVAPSDPSQAPDFPVDVRPTIDDTADDRARKCRSVQDWWRARGAEYHQAWRVWKDRCPRE